MTNAAGFVLAGGAGRRFGGPKTEARLGDGPLLCRAGLALQTAKLHPITVIGGDPDVAATAGFAHCGDEFPGQGPLGAIITALNVCQQPLAAVLAGDLADPDPTEVLRLIAAAEGHDVVVPVVEDQPQWLFAIWRRTSREHLKGAFADGVRAPRHAVADLGVSFVPSHGDRFRDVDTPADLRRERQYLANGPSHQAVRTLG